MSGVRRLPHSALLGLILLNVACSGRDLESTWEPVPGAALPRFEIRALDGTPVDSRSFSGRQVVLNFWATWCQSCRREMTELDRLARMDDARVFGIAIDREGAGAVAPFLERRKLGYPTFLGEESLFRNLGGITLPYTLVLDADQRLINVHRGPTSRAALVADLARSSTEPFVVGDLGS